MAMVVEDDKIGVDELYEEIIETINSLPECPEDGRV